MTKVARRGNSSDPADFVVLCDAYCIRRYEGSIIDMAGDNFLVVGDEIHPLA